MKNKKAQMEIMGLVIIVILIILAMLFVLQFIILRQPSDIRQTFIHKELASNTVNTMLATTTDCKELSIGKLLEDCAEGGFIPCSDIDPTLNSCKRAKEIIDEILLNTLDTWNKEYYLTVKSGGFIIEDLEFGDICSGEKITSAPCCILATGTGTMTINLDICS